MDESAGSPRSARDGDTRRASAGGAQAGDDPAPREIGPFQILETLGEGGMGTVYLAEQKEPIRRRVALKVIKLGMDSKAVLRRFELERQALAVMNHENIAKVLDAGTTERGQPWFAMEYTPGLPLDVHCDRHRLSLRDRIELFQQVCAGVQHAHTKGVIHRDLKPGNVLVTDVGGRAVPKIIDFGLARATDHMLLQATLFTEQGLVVGTPEYMAPEQADPGGTDIDTRVDVYALGVLLYELLSGTLPFTGKELRQRGLLEMQRVLRDSEAPRPSTKLSDVVEATALQIAERRRATVRGLVKVLRGDLDWVVLRCLEKDRNRRYDTANALAVELGRFLQHEPVLAGPPGAGYRLRKLVRKYRAQLAAVGAVLVTAVVGAVVAVEYAVEAREQAELAGENAQVANDRALEVSRQKAEVEAQRTRADVKNAEFEMLSSVVHLRRATEREQALYPAEPHMVAPMRAWLEVDAKRLTEALPRLRATVAALERRAEPPSAAEREAERRAHPEHGALEGLRAKLGALRAAQAVAAGGEFREASVPSELREATAQALNEYAWPRVSPDQDRSGYGEEALALAAVRLGVSKVEAGDGSIPLHELLDTQAWAELGCGLRERAVATSRRALDAAPAKSKDEYAGFLRRVEEHAAALVGEAAAQAIETMSAEVAAVEARVSARQSYRFASESEQFLFDTLRGLVTDIEAFESSEVAWVRERLEWAEQVYELTVERYRERWSEARRALLRADGISASTLYRDPPVDLAPQVGLVPIGMNPVTKLWEFLELRSAAPGKAIPSASEYDAEGRLPVDGDSGIVFVLLPGGKFLMGTQSADPVAANYDAEARDDESPVHDVTLSAFFLARHELTQGQWARLWRGEETLRRPSYHTESNFVGGRVTDAHPVQQVDWWMCESLLRRHGMVLPTEAQWEYGCRGGTTGPFVCARGELSLHANLADATAKTRTPWTCETWSDGHALHAPVGSFAANAFGLFDVHGNVWEWCLDNKVGYSQPVRTGDGLRQRGEGSSLRVNRGGSFRDLAVYARSALRGDYAPTFRAIVLGARPARTSRP